MKRILSRLLAGALVLLLVGGIGVALTESFGGWGRIAFVVAFALGLLALERRGGRTTARRPESPSGGAHAAPEDALFGRLSLAFAALLLAAATALVGDAVFGGRIFAAVAGTLFLGSCVVALLVYVAAWLK